MSDAFHEASGDTLRRLTRKDPDTFPALHNTPTYAQKGSSKYNASRTHTSAEFWFGAASLQLRQTSFGTIFWLELWVEEDCCWFGIWRPPLLRVGLSSGPKLSLNCSDGSLLSSRLGCVLMAGELRVLDFFLLKLIVSRKSIGVLFVVFWWLGQVPQILRSVVPLCREWVCETLERFCWDTLEHLGSFGRQAWVVCIEVLVKRCKGQTFIRPDAVFLFAAWGYHNSILMYCIHWPWAFCLGPGQFRETRLASSFCC